MFPFSLQPQLVAVKSLIRASKSLITLSYYVMRVVMVHGNLFGDGKNPRSLLSIMKTEQKSGRFSPEFSYSSK